MLSPVLLSLKIAECFSKTFKTYGEVAEVQSFNLSHFGGSEVVCESFFAASFVCEEKKKTKKKKKNNNKKSLSIPASGYGVVHEEGDESIQEDVECGA